MKTSYLDTTICKENRELGQIPLVFLAYAGDGVEEPQGLSSAQFRKLSPE